MNFTLEIFIMKTRLASSIRLSLMAGALALVVAGCGSTDRYADRSIEPVGYTGQSSSSSIPPSIDPFSRSYVAFPGSASDAGAVTGHSNFCMQHYSQPGCQTGDSPGNPKGMNNSSRY